MSEKYKIHDPEGIYFITTTIIDWVDLLSRPIYKGIIIDSLKYCVQAKGLRVYAYVIMSNHMHAIVSTDAEPLEFIIRDFKKFTSKQFIRAIQESNESRTFWLLKKFAFAAGRINRGVNYKIWQDGYHPVLLDKAEMIQQRLDYIHQNPVKAGYVYEPEHYVYSSAFEYAGGKRDMLKLEMIS